MQYRRLGKTGWQVSEIGFGAWGIGRSFWVGAEDKESLSALHAAVDAGVNFIDTALVYGDGHSETLVGQVVRERAERIYVATKVPPLNEHWPALPDDRVSDCFPPDHIITSTEQSLKSLKLDCVDLQQLHVWRDEWMEDQRWLEALHKLKQQGKVRAIGVSINDHEPETALTLVTSGVIDTVQVIYNISIRPQTTRCWPLAGNMTSACSPAVPLMKVRSPAPSWQTRLSLQAIGGTATSRMIVNHRS